jgi:hypothetical protein
MTDPDIDITVARVFDGTGARFAADHPTMADGPERDWVLAYLKAGADLLVTPGALPDVVDPSRGAVVPMSFRTDGSWVWTDTVAYYLEEHGLAPEPGLLHHIRTAAGPPRTPDHATLARAAAAIMAPPKAGRPDDEHKDEDKDKNEERP